MSLLVRSGRHLTRTTPALVLCALLVVLWRAFHCTPGDRKDQGGPPPNDSTTGWHYLLSVYLLLLHFATTLFPLRSFRALGHVTAKMNETSQELSIKEDVPASRQDLRFAIIVPAYKETMATLQTTLSVLAIHPQARSCYHIYLAMEEREKGSREKALHLQDLYREHFLRFTFTMHPGGLANEAPGKSSNESWAGKQIVKDYELTTQRSAVLVTTMDADSHLSWRYFAKIAQVCLASTPAERDATIYIPPVVFDRNAHQVPLLVRSADVFWAGAGISTMYANASVTIPTSVYTLPLSLLEHVGGWDNDHDAIGEDMHMYLKCLFALDGHLRVQVVHVAASQCNVCSDLRGIRGYIDHLRVRHQQAVRHMWGMLDTGFAIRLAVGMLIRRWKHWTLDSIGTAARMVRRPRGPRWPRDQTTQASSTHRLQAIQKTNVVKVFYHLVEAHMIPVHLALALSASSLYLALFPNTHIPFVLKASLHICSALRLVGFLTVVAFVRRYNQYHQLCVRLRIEDSERTSRPEDLDLEVDVAAGRGSKIGLREAVVFPISGVLFGVLPALQATVMHIFTIRLRYVVSLKPIVAAVNKVDSLL